MYKPKLKYYFIKTIKVPLWKKLLILEIVLLLTLTRICIIIFPFKTIVGFINKDKKLKQNHTNDKLAVLVGYLIRKLSERTPWESACLVQALTGKIMLQRRGLYSTIYLGLNKESNSMKAHAWLKYQDTIITGDNNGCYREFSVIKSFGDKNR